MTRITKFSGILGFTLACCMAGWAAGGFPIATNPFLLEFGGKVAISGTNYLAGLVAGAEVAGQWVAPNGQLAGAPIVVGANPGFPPAVAMASAGTNSLVAWTDHSVASDVTMFGRMISPGGVGSPFPLIATVGSHGVQEIQSAASDGTNFLVVWRDDSSGACYGQRVTGAGSLSGPEFLIFTMAGGGNRNLAVAFGRTNYLIAWQDGTGGGDQTYCKLITPGGVVGSAFQVNTTPSSDKNPSAIGFDGTNYLVVWNRSTNYSSGGWPEWRLCGRLVSQSGVALGSELVLVTEQASFPALAFDGRNYLLAWGYNTTTTNSDMTIHAQYLDRLGNSLGPVFTPFSAQGTNPPLLPLDGLLFDGQRFLLTATFGRFVLGPTGDVVGFSGGDVFGAFLRSSTMPPVFTNATVAGDFFRGQLVVAPGMTYTIQVSTNLQDWTSVGTVSSGGTNLLDLEDKTPVAGQGQVFYRAVVGKVIPVTFSLSFHEYAYAGGFGGGFTPTVAYPVALNSYTANFSVDGDPDPPPATNVYFTGPAGSGLTNQQADPDNSLVGSTGAEYQSAYVSNPTAAPGGAWVVNYRGTNVSYTVAEPQAASRLVIPVPTVTVSGGVLQSVTWAFRNAGTGAVLGGAPAYVTGLQVQIEGLAGGRIYESPWLAPGITNHTLTSTVNWSNVNTMHMAYDDSLGNHYVVTFSKP